MNKIIRLNSEVEYTDNIIENDLPFPCGGCHFFEAVVYPATLDHCEEYDSFCNAGMDQDLFLRYLEQRNDPNEECPVRVIERLDAELDKSKKSITELETKFKLACELIKLYEEMWEEVVEDTVSKDLFKRFRDADMKHIP